MLFRSRGTGADDSGFTASRTSPPSPLIPPAGREDVADVVSNRQTPPSSQQRLSNLPAAPSSPQPAASLVARRRGGSDRLVIYISPLLSSLLSFYLLPATVGRHKMGFLVQWVGCQCEGRRAVGYIDLGLRAVGEIRERECRHSCCFIRADSACFLCKVGSHSS